MKITNPRPRAGFTLVEIMIVVAIIGLLASIAIPNFVRARARAQTDACLNNLRQIDGAKQQWALENGKDGSAVPAWAGPPADAIQSYLGRDPGFLLRVYCPLNPPGAGPNDPAVSYEINEVGTAPQCKKQQQIPVEHPAILK